MLFSNMYAMGTQVNAAVDILRSTFFFIDGIIYSIIPLIYNLIFRLYDLNTLFNDNGEVLSKIVTNMKTTIYSFLAIVMFFKVAVSLLTMLVDPSLIEDKEKGAGKIVLNIAISLILIVVVPLLFKVARDIQNRAMDEHWIEKIVIGEDFGTNERYTLGNELSLATWSVFLNPVDANTVVSNAYDDLFNNEKSIGIGAVWPVAKLYLVLNSVTGVPIAADIVSKFAPGVNDILNFFGAGSHYQLSYVFLLSTIVGIYVAFAMWKMMIDVAYRSLKFFVLELLSPIAIISYIDPNSAKKGLFSKWSKEVLKTYLSLFIRIFVLAIATVLLRSFALSDIATNKLTIANNRLAWTTGNTQFVKLIYVIAAAAFIKNAPKFIDELFATTLSKGSETKVGRELIRGLIGAGVSSVAGAISGFDAAASAGKNKFWGALSGGISGAQKGYNAGKKNLIGVVPTTIDTVQGQYKSYGIEHDLRKERLVREQEGKVDRVDNAKRSAIAELTANNEQEYMRILNTGADYGDVNGPAGKVNGRTYGRGLASDARLRNTIKKNHGAWARDAMIHEGDDEYLALRRRVFELKDGEAMVKRTLELAQEDWQINNSSYQNSGDKKQYIIDFATQTANMNYGEMSADALRNEFESQVRVKAQRGVVSQRAAFSSMDTNAKINLAVNDLGIDRATASGMSEADLTAAYNTYLEGRVNVDVSRELATYDSATAEAKVNMTASRKKENITQEVSAMSEAQLDARFVTENGERIEATYGHSYGDIAADAAKIEGDVKAAQGGLDDYFKTRGKRAKEIDSAYATAEARKKAGL